MTVLGMSRIAFRNLWRNPRRTLLTMLAIAFGLFLAIIMTGMQDRSFADMIDDAARMGGGHVSVQHPEYLDAPTLTRTVADASAVIAIAEQDPLVERAVPRISGQAMIATARDSYGAFFMAFDPTVEDETTNEFLGKKLEGEPLSAESGNGVVLGRKLASNLGVGLGDKVVYTMMDKEGEIVGGLGRVRGLLDTGAPSLDAALILLPIQHLRKQLSYGEHEATQVAIFLNDSRRSKKVSDRLGPTISSHGTSVTWYEARPELSGFIAMKVGGGRFMEGVILILVTASIFNTLFVSVIERTREFGIQLAIGFTPLQITTMVLWESFWLAICGIALGAVPTGLLYNYLAANGIDVSAQFGDANSMEVAGVGFEMILKFGIFPENAAIIVAAIVGATMLAGLYPAWRAGRTEPADAIHLV